MKFKTNFSNLNRKVILMIIVLCVGFVFSASLVYGAMTLNDTLISSDGTITLTPATSVTINGNVGIGATGPLQKLTVAGDTTQTLKAGYLSVDNFLISQLEGGSYFGRVGVKENGWALNNYGNTWVAKGGFDDWFIAMSSDGKLITAVAHAGGQIYISSDYGDTWTAKDSGRNWQGIAMSSDGKIQTATPFTDQIFVSTDYGNTWTAKDSSRSWKGVAMSSDGKIQTAVVSSGQIYVSTDYGNTWTPKESSRAWVAVAMSSDGKIQTAEGNLTQIYVSTDYGNTWTAKDSSRSWKGVAMSSDGKIQTSVSTQPYISSDYGNTWTLKTVTGSTVAVAMSSSGKIQILGTFTNQVLVSTDYGGTWTGKNLNSGWQSVAMSSDGKIQAASASISGQIYFSFADTYIPGGNVGIGTTSPGSLFTVGKDAIAVTSTDGITLQNATAATSGVPVQMSPRLRFRSNVWNTTSTGSNNTDDWYIETLPASSTGPTSSLKIKFSANGAGASTALTLTGDGQATFNAGVSITGLGGISIQAGAKLQWGVTRSLISSPADGQSSFTNAGDTIGVRLKYDALPTVSSGFGTSPAVTAGSTPLSGSVNVGTGGAATTGVINFNGTAFPSAPFCTVSTALTNVPTRVTTSTTQLTLTTTTAWTASDVVSWICVSSK